LWWAQKKKGNLNTTLKGGFKKIRTTNWPALSQSLHASAMAKNNFFVEKAHQQLYLHCDPLFAAYLVQLLQLNACLFTGEGARKCMDR
jgi:hypothetical protein